MQLLIFCHHRRNVIKRSLQECLMATTVTRCVELTSIKVCNQEHQKYSISVVINSLASISQHISGSAVLLTFVALGMCCKGVRDLSKHTHARIKMLLFLAGMVNLMLHWMALFACLWLSLNESK